MSVKLTATTRAENARESREESSMPEEKRKGLATLSSSEALLTQSMGGSRMLTRNALDLTTVAAVSALLGFLVGFACCLISLAEPILK